MGECFSCDLVIFHSQSLCPPIGVCEVCHRALQAVLYELESACFNAEAENIRPAPHSGQMSGLNVSYREICHKLYFFLVKAS